MNFRLIETHPVFCDMQRKEIEKARQLLINSKKDIKSCIVNQNNWYPYGITPYGSTVMEYQNEQQKTAAGRQNDPIFQVSWSIASCFKEYVHTTLQDDQSVAQGNVVWYVCHLNCKIYISSCIVGLKIFTLDSIITSVLAYTHI